MFAFRSVRLKVVPPCPALFRAASTSTTASAVSHLRSFAYGTTVVIAGGAFVAYYSDSRSAIHQYVFAPLLRSVLDGEATHKLALRVLRSGLHPRDQLDDDARLRVQVRMQNG
jgi:dihydroorotate dehydrogenase